ncbi:MULTISPECIES: Lsr2 family protein [unclassified Amycolatopsis]|uniref:histone-like nucleoid-structuring protein Lsr2 n=1 Tax=unclassified Amycolatopsis TaxID=2618356 RepID=UPI001FF1484B|nr:MULTISPECIES: Lsr2 family protein [unclassified Amycolatopsis]UOZ02966.1 Lsr2 family protein [Amycolatopsis sp. WQ 127309]WSJ78436.1 Lsr2 family protein [Amycolatopsis sp. NBC_01307]WSK77999.1 Lsr2 family protein [Amycolatopsis sp. NBC_01286]
MAQKVLVEMLDDLDGSPATHTIPFGLDGVSYEIDLSDDNATALRGELARFIAASRKTGGRKVRVATGQSTASSADRERSRAIRAWAGESGYEVSERGRLSSEIVTAYDEAQRQAAEPVAARKRTPRKKVAAVKK